MSMKGSISRNLYVRITDKNGKRKYVTVGMIFKNGEVWISEGMPKPEWWLEKHSIAFQNIKREMEE